MQIVQIIISWNITIVLKDLKTFLVFAAKDVHSYQSKYVKHQDKHIAYLEYGNNETFHGREYDLYLTNLVEEKSHLQTSHEYDQFEQL